MYLTAKRKKSSRNTKNLLFILIITATIFAIGAAFYAGQQSTENRSHASELENEADSMERSRVCGKVNCANYRTANACNSRNHAIWNGLSQVGVTARSVCGWYSSGKCLALGGYGDTQVSACGTAGGTEIGSSNSCSGGRCGDRQKFGCTKPFRTGLCPGPTDYRCCQGALVR